MKPSPISILLDSNERGSERAKALALACGGDPQYELQGFAELPVDISLSYLRQVKAYDGPRNQMAYVFVELKEISDFWASKATGHLGQQILQMISEGQPGFVVVFGSLQETLTAVPKISQGEGRPRRRSQMEIQSDISTARAFCADAAACGVPVHFLSRNHEQSFRWVLSYAKNILTSPSLASWLPRFPVDPVGYGCLCSIPSIGDAAAKALLQEYGSIATLVMVCRNDPGAVALARVNGKALGRAKASKLMRAFGCKVPGAWA